MLDELDRDFEAETGFGTGLRAHLRAQYDPAPEPVEPELEAEPEPEAEPDAPDPREVELAAFRDRLTRSEVELAAREQSLLVREQALEAEARRIAEARVELEKHLDVRELLRARAELEADRLWRTFDEALEATMPDGAPDFATRLHAARALLAEAYATTVDPTAAQSAVMDELAELRERKVV